MHCNGRPNKNKKTCESFSEFCEIREDGDNVIVIQSNCHMSKSWVKKQKVAEPECGICPRKPFLTLSFSFFWAWNLKVSVKCRVSLGDLYRVSLCGLSASAKPGNRIKRSQSIARPHFTRKTAPKHFRGHKPIWHAKIFLMLPMMTSNPFSGIWMGRRFYG